MTSETPRDDRCGARCRDGGYCERYPIEGSDRCRQHGGASTGPTDADKLAGNQNATDHGLYADPANLLEHLEEADGDAYEWILRKHDSYLQDAPFTAGSAKADALRQVCAQEYVIWKALRFQIQGGVVRETKKRGADGELHQVLDENPVNLPLDRMQRTVTRRLKELGVLDDPDSQQAQATAGKVAALREMMNSVDGVGGVNHE